MRVIAGRLRGRRLVAPAGLETRPTIDRVREALFSALSSLADFGGTHVLDLYAGTGALGIEAISRGADFAVFVESSRPALTALRDNLAAVALTDAARVLEGPVARAVPRLLTDPRAPFDLIFADPPYDDVDNALSALEALVPVFAPGARIVLEHSSRRPPRPSSILQTLRTRTYGDTALAYLAIAPPATLEPAPPASSDAAPAASSDAAAPASPEDGHAT